MHAWFFANYNLNGGGGDDTATTMDATVLPAKQNPWPAQGHRLARRFRRDEPGLQPREPEPKSYAIAVDEVLTAYWS